MYQQINQLNVSITTNRTCTLKCSHCYIQPELFKSKEQMTKNDFKLVFERVRELLASDSRLDVVEWEVIGGETTMMPYEWWEEMLPYALKQIDEINTTTKQAGKLNFLSNLIYKDKRYTELFKKYKDHPTFVLYTSWEPDTNRFGNNNKLYPKFKQTLKDIGSTNVTLDLILTKALVQFDPQTIVDEFSDLGVCDYSIKMISPFGSGKEFFKHNMVDFQSMSTFVNKFEELSVSKKINYTPRNEMEGSLFRNTAFQCNGGFKYDLSIEPDGMTHFNANQTGDEMARPSCSLHISDEDWAIKTMFENKPEEAKRYSSSDLRCYQCEFFRHCCGGWFHYRSASHSIIEAYAKDECQGLKKTWMLTKSSLNRELFNIDLYNHLTALSQNEKIVNTSKVIVNESVCDSFESYLYDVLSADEVMIHNGIMFDKSVFERCLFYEDVGVTYCMSSIPTGNDGALILYHLLNTNLTNLKVPKDEVLKKMSSLNYDIKVNILCQLYDLLCEHSKKPKRFNVIPLVKVHLDSRNNEIIRSLISMFFDSEDLINCEHHYVSMIASHIDAERQI